MKNMITILPSAQLDELKLHDLAGRRGELVGHNESGTGYYVQLEEEFMGEKEWFVPCESVEL